MLVHGGGIPDETAGSLSGDRIADMPTLTAATDVDCYVGGALRLAGRDPFLGPQLARVALTLRVACIDLPAEVTIELYEPVTVHYNDARINPDVELQCTAEFLDRYMRGERRLVDALAQGEVVAHGRVSRVLKALPVIEQTFFFYQKLLTLSTQSSSLVTGALS